MPRLNFFQDTLAILITACILLIYACVSCYEDGDEQGSRIPDHTSSGNFSGWRHYKILQIPERCKYRSLTKCHINPDNHSNYQLNCFNGACKENETYFCLNGPKNYTIHACGPTKRCKKRHKGIFKHETHVKGETLRVYTVECEAGYFQPAYFQRDNWNCFTKCEKDESVVILQNATKDRPAICRCNSHKNYCNGYDLSLFELGSSDDHCLHAELDLKIRCDKEEELLPNCTCAVKCNIGTVRDWNDSLNCISKSATQSATDTDISQLKSEPTTTASYQSSQITDQDKEEGSKMTNKIKNVPDIKRDSTDDVEQNPSVVTVSVETTVFTVVACVSFLMFALLAVIVWQIRRQEYYNLPEESRKKWPSVMEREYIRSTIQYLEANVKKKENEKIVTQDNKDDSNTQSELDENEQRQKRLKLCTKMSRSRLVPIDDDNQRVETGNVDERLACLNPREVKALINFLILVAFIGSLTVVYPMVLHTQHTNEYTYGILFTKLCSRTNFNRSQSCQTNDFQLHETIKHCGFQELCKLGYEARCINILERGMAHVCVLKNLSCGAGVWRKAWIDKDNKRIVRTQEEICPKGKFQSTKSNCFDACQTKHLNISGLRQRFKVYTVGDNKSPTYVYCDYKKGYVNPSGKTFLNYDQDITNYPLFCRKQENINLSCVEHEIPLPNGTCVRECRTGECRDDHDDFICKRNCSFNERSNAPKDDSIDHKELPEIATERNSTEPLPTDAKLNNIQILIVFILLVLICIIAFIIVLVLMHHHRTRSRSRDSPGTVSSSNNDNTRRFRYSPGRTLPSIDGNTDPPERKLLLKKSGTPCGEKFKKSDDNTLTQPILNSLNEQMKYAGALMTDGVIGGTVFRVGSKYVMTAYHVIQPVIWDYSTKDLKKDRLYGDNIFVNFNAAVGESPPILPHIKKICYINTQLDVVILELTTLSGVPGKMLLNRGDTKLVMDTVSVIGYGHPKHQLTKHLDPSCKLANGIDVKNAKKYYKKKKKTFKASMPTNPEVIEEGYKGCDDSRFILFHGFMEHGASGAPLLICKDPKSVHVVGVLTHGIPEFFYQLPEQMQKKFPSKHLFHKGCKMQLIYEDLKDVDPHLAEDIF